MKDKLELTCVPCNEECEQVGTAGYNPRKAKAECRAFINQLRRVFGSEPEGARLYVASNPHDFGTYNEVTIVFDADLEGTVEYAYKIEGDLPEEWDAEAIAELAEYDQCEANALAARIAANL